MRVSVAATSFNLWMESPDMIRLRIIASPVAGLAALPCASLAQSPAEAPQSQEAAPVEVIYSYGRRERAAEDVGSAASVISADDIDANQFAFVADALKLAPGVSIARNGGAGGLASARIRGSSSGQTLVVIDGVVVNDPSAPQGGFNFANLDVADIDRIEVLRGPQSIIYGADAIGGVIAIRTKRSGPSLSAYAEGGSRGTARSGATWFGERGEAFARATISGATSDGLSRASSGTEADGYRTLAASLTAGTEIGNGAALTLFARGSDSRAEIDGFPPPFFLLGDTEETEDATDYSFSARLTHGGFDRTSGDGVSGALSASYSGVDRANADLGIETFAATGDRLSADYVLAAPLSPFMTIEAGGEAERTQAKVSGVDESATAGAVFALLEASLGERLTLSAGARRDEFSNFDGATTTRVAAAWTIGERTRVHASWGEGFRAPTLFELNFDQFGAVPNPDLRPERASGFDIGIDRDAGPLHFAATFFRQRVRDQIDFDFAGAGYFNIDRVKSKGAELEIGAQLGTRASAHVVYSFIDAEDALTGAAVLRTPRHSGTIALAFAPTDRFSLSASAIFNGREADFPAPNDSFTRLDLRAAYSLSDAIELYARVENATDTDYEDVSGYQEPGASAFAGVRVRRW
ncbi:MAG: TonB-dependent receptor plug domain-containing protein [Pseudomonadota bacterium]